MCAQRLNVHKAGLTPPCIILLPDVFFINQISAFIFFQDDGRVVSAKTKGI